MNDIIAFDYCLNTTKLTLLATNGKRGSVPSPLSGEVTTTWQAHIVEFLTHFPVGNYGTDEYELDVDNYLCLWYNKLNSVFRRAAR